MWPFSIIHFCQIKHDKWVTDMLFCHLLPRYYMYIFQWPPHCRDSTTTHSLVIRILYAWKSHSEIVMAIGKKRAGLLPSPYMLKLSGSTAFFCSKQSLTFQNMTIIQSGRLSLLQNDHLATGTPPVSSNATPRTQRATSTLLPRGKDFSRIGW